MSYFCEKPKKIDITAEKLYIIQKICEIQDSYLSEGKVFSHDTRQNPQKEINFKDKVRMGITIQEMKSLCKDAEFIEY